MCIVVHIDVSLAINVCTVNTDAKSTSLPGSGLIIETRIIIKMTAPEGKMIVLFSVRFLNTVLGFCCQRV